MRRLSTILPAMRLAEALETTGIPRVAGRTGARRALVMTPPCHAAPQTISPVGLIGGGHLPRPGEVSRAQHGMRCRDARPECRRHVLEVLRQPLEESITRINLPRVLDVAMLAMLASCLRKLVAHP